MGIYIKGMEMPKENEYVHLVIKNDGTIECVKSIFHINKPTTLIEMEQTTATEVPEPHGDLVDHSEIGEILIKALDECEISEADKRHVLRMTWITPTVIEGTEWDEKK